MNARQPYPPSRKGLLGLILFIFLLTACGTQPAPPAAPTSPPTETPTPPQPTLTPTPTEMPIPTPTPIPTLPSESLGGLAGVPDPRATAPKLFDLSNSESPIPQFVNAMKMGGIEVDPEEVANNLQYQTITGADGKQYVIASFNLDPDPNQQGETLEGLIPLMIAQKNEIGEWKWSEATPGKIAEKLDLFIGINVINGYLQSWSVESSRMTEIVRKFNGALINYDLAMYNSQYPELSVRPDENTF